MNFPASATPQHVTSDDYEKNYRPDTTEVLLILDNSSSMVRVTTETIHGINTFLTEQQALEEDENAGTANFSMITFDDSWKVVLDGEWIKETAQFTRSEYIPRGATALYDGIGHGCNMLDQRIRGLSEEKSPKSVLVAILTDGDENCSEDFTLDLIRDMIKSFTNNHGWTFLFLGVGKSAKISAQDMGIKNAIEYDSQHSLSVKAFSQISTAAKHVRSTGLVDAGLDDDLDFLNKG